MTDRIRIAVLGASGYTGADLVRLALTHTRVEIAALAANAKAGQSMQAILPHFAPYKLPTPVNPEEIDFSNIAVVFGCLPHASSAELLSKVEGASIYDLFSYDERIVGKMS